MPIGKNSIKRVTNNGYSKVKTTAPDMENSTEIKEIKKDTAPEKKTANKPSTKKAAKKKASNESAEKKTAPKAETKAAPKNSTKKPPVKKSVISAPSPETLNAFAEDNRPDGFVRSPLGSDLPIYLL